MDGQMALHVEKGEKVLVVVISDERSIIERGL